MRRLEETSKGDMLELSIVPAQIDGSEQNPGFLHIGAIHNGTYIDLESIDDYSWNLVIKSA